MIKPHPAAVARTTPEARRGRSLAERLAMLAPGLTRRIAARVVRMRPSRGRRALIAWAYRRTYAAYNRRDWEFNTLLIDPDSYELHPGDMARITPDAEPVYRGVEGYLEATALWMTGWGMAAVRYEDFVEVEPGRTLVALIRFVGEGAGSGMRLDQPVADIHALRDGMLVRQTYYWDRNKGLEAAGLQPSRS
jgi:ketosteroid isomerase-like protein